MGIELRLRLGVVGGLGVLLLMACPPSPVVDAGTDAGSDAGVVEVVDAGPPAPIRLKFDVAVGTALTEERLLFNEDAADVDPVAWLSLSTPIALKDYRVRLFDWNDQVVPSDDTAQGADGGLSYRIELTEPLKTGRTYTLVVDAERGPQLADEAGRTYDDVRLTLKVRGEIVPDKPAKKSGKKK